MSLKMHEPDARQRAANTREFNRSLDEENVIALRREGMVPVAIADRLGIGWNRVRGILQDNGLESLGFVSKEPAGPRTACPHCGAVR